MANDLGTTAPIDRPSAQPTHSPRKVKTKTVLQMEEAECGAASLAMILSYFGRDEPLEKLRVSCGVSRDGSNAANLLKASGKYGLEGHGYRKSVDRLKEVKPPYIIFWNFNHYLVVEGFHRDQVYLNDPARGRLSLPESEFDDQYSGVVLTFEPTASFTKERHSGAFFSALARRLSKKWVGIIFAAIVGALLVVPTLFIPIATQVFVNNVLIAHRNQWVGPLVIALALILALQAGLTWVQQYALLRLQMKLSLTTSSGFLWHLLRLPLTFFTQRYPGGIVTRVQLNDTIAQLLSGQLATAIVNVTMIVFYAIMMFVYSWLLTLVAIAIALVNLAALLYVSRRRRDNNQRLLNETYRLDGVAFGGLQIIESVKAEGSEGDFFSRYAGFQARVANTTQKLGIITSGLNIVPSFMSNFSIVATISVGALLVMQGKLSLGGLIAFQALTISFSAPIANLITLGTEIQNARGEMAQLDDVTRNPLDTAYARKPTEPLSAPAAKLKGFVEFHDVSFGYSPLGPPLIEHFSLKLKPGSRVALVGRTGSGKSTVANIVSGLYPPWSGTVLFDGKERSEIPLDVMTNSLAQVSQDVFLFEGTIASNISLWDTTITETTIRNAAQHAAISHDIEDRPGSYQAHLAERGQNFSGGQKQRLEIARALCTKPTILVLDEATSALDPTTELEIDNAIRRRGITCLIVAHRLSTIRDCDEIIVLEQGRIVQRGTHEEMKDQPGLYAELIKAT